MGQQSQLPSSTMIVSAGPSSCFINILKHRNRIGRTAATLNAGATML